MSKRKSIIVDMRPVSSLDDPNAPKTFVPVRREEVAPEEMDAAHLAEARNLRPPAPIATQVTTGDHVSRAWAFTIKTWQLAALAGFASWLILGHLATGHPLLSLGAVVWLITGVIVVWAGSFLLDWLSSPETANLFDVLLFWRYMSREQKERHRRMREAQRYDR